MNTALLSAMSAVAGSGVGAFASFATTWLTLDRQERATQVAQAVNHREQFYGEFIDEAARLIADALIHHLDDPSKVVRLYAMVGRMRLFGPRHIVARAEEVMQQIIAIYERPNVDFHDPAQTRQDSADVLRQFSEMCRDDLQHLTRGRVNPRRASPS